MLPQKKEENVRVSRKVIIASFIFICGAAIFAAPASAVPTLDFGIESPTLGSISYDGGANPLIGTNIQIDSVIGLNTPLLANITLPLTNAVLKFKTGNLTRYINDENNPLKAYYFGEGGSESITIVGGAKDQIAGTTLLTGKIDSVTVIAQGPLSKASFATFMDFKSPELLKLFGLPTALPDGNPFPYVGNFNISFSTNSSLPPSPFASTRIFGGNLTNSPVPEPSTLLLLISGLAGLIFMAAKDKFRMKASVEDFHLHSNLPFLDRDQHLN
jgi:hypothetical protein